MKFSELVRLLERNGFKIVKEKGSIRYYRKPGWDKLIRVDYITAQKKCPRARVITSSKQLEYKFHKEEKEMIELQYSLIIEATEEPDYFGFYSTDLEGFSGIGHSVEDCLFKAKWGMKEHVELLKQEGLPVPPNNPDPRIIVQNEKKLAVA